MYQTGKQRELRVQRSRKASDGPVAATSNGSKPSQGLMCGPQRRCRLRSTLDAD